MAAWVFLGPANRAAIDRAGRLLVPEIAGGTGLIRAPLPLARSRRAVASRRERARLFGDLISERRGEGGADLPPPLGEAGEDGR